MIQNAVGMDFSNGFVRTREKMVLSLSENNNRDVRSLLSEPDAVQDEQRDNTNR